MSATVPFAATIFSTDSLPERDRVPVLCDVFGRQLLRLETDPFPDARFYTHLEMRALPGLRMFAGAAAGTRFRRTRELMADGNDEIGLILKKNGTNTISHRGRDAVLGDGDACLYSSAETSTFTIISPVQSIGLGVPYAALAPLVSNIGDALGRLMPCGTAAMGLLRSYVGALQDDAALQSAEARHQVVNDIYDLIALVIGATRDARETAKGRGVRAARLRAVKTDVKSRLADPELSIHAVARRHQVTERYIQMLFRGEGTTYRDFVLGQRLNYVYRVLTAPKSADCNIGDVVFATGFGDLSYFNKSFRKQYGTTPSAIRAEARRAYQD